MEQATRALAPGSGQVFLPASVTLAFQRMRHTWRMLCLVGLGVLAAVIVVCAVPLYSQVAMTAGLRTILTSSSQSADIVVSGSSYHFSPADLNGITGSLDQEFQQHLGPYLLPEQFTLQTSPFPIMATNASGRLAPTGDLMNIIGTDTTRAAPHIHLVQGRLPSATVIGGNTIEIAVRKEIANSWKPGTIIPVLVTYNNAERNSPTAKTFYLRVVGLFILPKTDDPFWHGESFLGFAAGVDTYVNSSLVSNTALVSLIDQLEPDPSSGLTASIFSSLTWYYTLNASQISIGQLDTILNGVKTVQQDNANNVALSQNNAFQHITTSMSSAALQLYHDRLPVMQFPVMSLTLFVVALALFFVTLMTGILVERQMGALALLRSRGASSRQIFWSMVTQALLLGLIALVVGPLLTIILVRQLAEHILTATNQSALNTISGNPIAAALSVGLYALATAGAMALAMILTIWGAANRDVLALRRETARSTHRPFWQRLNLDMLAVVIALLGAGLSLYLSNSSVLDSRARLLYLSPLALIEAVCVLLAALLLLLRGFPWLLRGGSLLTKHLRGAASQIALAQMSRAPRQSMRLTLLLALATAFTIFTLVFNASQTQRIQDVSDYQAMADFSGTLQAGVLTPQQIANAIHSYARLPGVLSTSLGYAKPVNAGTTSLNQPIDFKAVDSKTFAQTVRWSPQDSTQSLYGLMHQLATARASSGGVPAIVDTATWNELHLTPGAHFSLNFSVVGADDLVQFRVVAEVQHIPTSNNTNTPGVMADYQSFADAYMHNYSTSGGYESPVNYIWLRTSDNSQQLAALRGVLKTSLTSIYDRRQIAAQLSNEPLYLTLFGILLLGAATALLLALIGNLVASWLNASSRLANFAALRALGASPGQIAGTLAWEQMIIYATAILLGFFFGWLLSILVLPSLIFTSILPNQINGAVDSQTFYAAQSTPPIQIVIPAALWIALGTLIVLCIVALGMMVRIVSRPSIAQVLRLNED